MNERLGSREFKVSKDELKPEVRRYVEKLEMRIKQKLADLGFEKSSELEAAITKGGPSFELDIERRNELIHASDEIAELVMRYKEAKDNDIAPAIEAEYEGNKEFIEKYRDRIRTLEIGGKTRSQLIQAIRAESDIGVFTMMLLNNEVFDTSTQSQEIITIRVALHELFEDKNVAPTTEEIFIKAKEYGLELCPSITGPYYFIEYSNQLPDNRVLVAVDLLQNVANGIARTFSMRNTVNNASGTAFGAVAMENDEIWPASEEFVFQLRKKEENDVQHEG